MPESLVFFQSGKKLQCFREFLCNMHAGALAILRYRISIVAENKVNTRYLTGSQQ